MPAPASAPGSETNAVPEGGADEGSCWGERESWVHVSLMLWYHLRLGKSATKLEAASLGLPGNQSLRPGLPLGPKGSSFLKADQKE